MLCKKVLGNSQCETDRWEWGVITLRSCVGLALSLLALLDIGAPKKPLDDDGTASDSKIWILTLGTTQWP